MPDRKENPIKKIRQFNNDVKELLTLDFSNYVRKNKGIGTTWYGNGRKPKTEWPSEDSVGNFMRILRFLMYDGREQFSIRCLATHYNDLTIPNNFKIKYNQLRASFNNYLDSNTRTKYAKEPKLTNRKLIKHFMYAKYIHQNEHQVKRLNQLLETLGHLELHRELRITLWDVLDYLEMFSILNTQVLEYLESN